jgi:hypothetical protein
MSFTAKLVGMSLLMFACIACGGRQITPGEEELGSRFSGLWLVQAPMPTEITPHPRWADLYDFIENGAIALIGHFCSDSWAERDSLTPCESHGRALHWIYKWNVHGEKSARCNFDGQWSSTDEQQLQINGQCTDGQQRSILLTFRSPASSNFAGADVILATVNNDPGWQLSYDPWEWKKCLDENCARED